MSLTVHIASKLEEELGTWLQAFGLTKSPNVKALLHRKSLLNIDRVALLTIKSRTHYLFAKDLLKALRF